MIDGGISSDGVLFLIIAMIGFACMEPKPRKRKAQAKKKA